MRMDYDVVKRHFIDLIPQIQDALKAISNGSVGTCFTSSEIARQLFCDYGVKCETVFVRGVIENDISRELRKKYSIMNPEYVDAMKSNGGWTGGVGMGNDEQGRPNFHAVLHFPDAHEILDMTTKLFHRPQYNIYMPECYYGSVDGYWGMYSDGFPQEIIQIHNFREICEPFIDRDPKCKAIIRQFRKELRKRIEKEGKQ